MTTDNSVPRITELRIKGLRTLEDVTLKLGNVNVLIGENGCGKSSVVEACVLLRSLVEGGFTKSFSRDHGSLGALLRFDATELELGVAFELKGVRATYLLAVGDDGSGRPIVLREALRANKSDDSSNELLIARRGSSVKTPSRPDLDTTIEPHELLLQKLSAFTREHPNAGHPPDATRFLAALSGVDVHVPFTTGARWVNRALGLTRSMRDPSVIEPVTRLDLGAVNLASAFHDLKNERSPQHWETTMDYVRLGLGEDIESINTRADAGGGSIGLTLKRRGIQRQEPAFTLSEGMLAYLAFVAIFRLEAPTSLLVFDEPDVHLHPSLLARVVGFAESIGERCPVLITTHSDRLLDYLSDPVGSAVLMELDEKRSTRLLRPDPELYAKWMKDYAGLGDLRADGAERSIFTREDAASGGRA